MVECPSIPFINICDQHSIYTLIDTWLTHNWHLDWQSTNFWSMHASQSTPGPLLADCWSSVEWVLTKFRSKCWLSADQDADWGYWSTVDCHNCVTPCWNCKGPCVRTEYIINYILTESEDFMGKSDWDPTLLTAS